MNTPVVSWLLIAEITLPFIVLSLVLIAMLLNGRKKNKEAAHKLILKIKNNEQRQRNNLQDFLSKKLALDDAIARNTSKKIINERKFLFRNLISALLDKNVDALAMLEEDLTRITDHYHNLKVQLEATGESDADALKENEENKATIEELKQEIKSLKHEVHVTLTTLNNIFGEFSSMFGEEVPDTEMSVDQIITAMETFSNKNATDDSAVDAESDEKAFEEDTELEEQEPDAFNQNTDENSEAEPEKEDPAVANQSAEEIPEPENASDVEGESKSDEDDALDFSIDSDLDDIDSALDELELGQSEVEEPSWDEAFEESGDKIEDKD